ncbi:MAG: sigma-70 family RNA polymerase sigma factor [Saprospiraceae bacterium]
MNQLDRNPYLRDEYFIHTIKPGGCNGEKAILGLYTSYYKAVRDIISDLVRINPGCYAQTDDILHDAFLIMIHKIQYETVSVKSLKAFWIGISKRLILNQVRRHRRLIFVEDVEEDYGSSDISPETIFIITEENKAIEKFIEKSGGRCKALLLLWLARYDMDEIAQELKLSGAKMARKIKYLCFNKLRKLLSEGHVIEH